MAELNSPAALLVLLHAARNLFCHGMPGKALKKIKKARRFKETPADSNYWISNCTLTVALNSMSPGVIGVGALSAPPAASIAYDFA